MKIVHLIAISIILITNFSCMRKQPADLIIYNATIYSVNEQNNVFEAIAIHNGKIVATGTSEQILKRYSANNLLNIEGRFVYPGFYDGHCHFLGYGLEKFNVDLTGTSSLEEIIDRLQNFDANSDQWITGRGWDQNNWPVKEFPTREILDAVFPDKPVYLTRIDGHAAWVNTKALEISNITSITVVEGGEIVQRNNIPSGILIDNAMQLVSMHIPKPGTDKIINALQMAEKDCFSVGLTTVCDAGLNFDEVLAIDSAQKQGLISMGIYAMLNPQKDNMEYFVKNGPYITDNLTVRSIKLFADGALGSRGALLLQPYSDQPSKTGILVNESEYFEPYCKLAYKHGYQVNTHCIGDGANRLILDIYGSFLKGQNDKRWRIEHAQIVHYDDVGKFRKYSVIPSVQSTHATSDMYWVAYRLGTERTKYAYAYKELLDQNKWLVNGSDFPVESINPLLGFYAAVARRDTSGLPEEGFQSENAISRDEAIRAMTIWAAKSCFEETHKGSLEPGKNADLVVLDHDIMKMELLKIPTVKVLKTIKNGRIVFTHPAI